ncbi:YigZ family protein [Desulforamulus ferrireducens]|uniref:YigZ family protein n=1 Tax=Desulforamulus ferrireducens TaxID=1833852 RepID=A0A1S6IZ85_9FIRM|nr:YigZ family protein [Desulforamulus ferrireducens]AQS60083.1 YigZ family protein [Desulforamulus ferrireducens]
MLTYRTVATEVVSELVIKKSRFITHVKPVPDEAAAAEFIRQVSKTHWQATHNVPAYRITENIEKCSDDGEPSGTAGRPVLSVIKGENLYYTAVVVTRYFGGIMLGAGGLVRAYSQAAAQGINEAGIVTRVLSQRLQVQFAMPLFGIIKKVIEQSGAKILEVAVTDKAVIVARLPVPEVEGLVAKLVEVSAGQAVVENLEQEYV